MRDNIYNYKINAKLIVYHMQSKLGLKLSDELRHDIYSNVKDACLVEAGHAIQIAEDWKRAYMQLKSRRMEMKWNEMRIRVARERDPIPPEMYLEWMQICDENEEDLRTALNKVKPVKVLEMVGAD